jgi:CO/xanthine dehydrogenase Mo-binding subunit
LKIDFPSTRKVILREQCDQGMKGFAEAPSLATAPAILNAIYDAIGVRITELPADKKRVRQALGL